MKKSQKLVTNIMYQMQGLNKKRREFMISLFLLLLGLRGRHNFLNLSRYGDYCEKSYRLHYEQPFDFLDFNIKLSKQYLSSGKFLIFDPSFLPKSGKQTPHLGKYWSGCEGRAIRGLEVGGLAIADLQHHTAFHLNVTQTPDNESLEAKGKNYTRIDHYASCIINAYDQLKDEVEYLCVDGYFAKQKFLDQIRSNTELHVISKLRKDASLRYLYHQPTVEKKVGRPRLYDGKVDVKNIDKQRLKLVYQDQDVELYEAMVNAKNLKRNVALCYVNFLENGIPTGKYQLLFSTNTTLAALTIYLYYKVRFQIEFLFRDAKQYTGLTQCEARSENKMNFHYNTSLTAINIAKATHHLNLPKEERKAFSMANVKTLYFNEMILNLILSDLEIQAKKKKIKKLKRKIRKLGKIAS